ncbi:hypothetical protein LINGRAHAP2_LOCUS23150 [Linum grandiflorum]
MMRMKLNRISEVPIRTMDGETSWRRLLLDSRDYWLMVRLQFYGGGG